MPANSESALELPSYGFIHIVELGGDVVIGGYLIVNGHGRPIEFHCTEPVKPNRAQRILYGDSLRPYLYGEQIGGALVTNAEAKADVICADRSETLTLRSVIDQPMVWIADTESARPAGMMAVELNTGPGYIDAIYAGDQPQIERLFGLAAKWDLVEPFERIGEAVSELQKVA